MSSSLGSYFKLSNYKASILVVSLFHLFGCSTFGDEGLNGTWIVKHMINKNGEIFPNRKNFKITILHLPYSNKTTITFDKIDHTVLLPGINTEDIPFKWIFKKDTITLTVDTTQLILQYLPIDLDSFINRKPKENKGKTFNKLLAIDSLKELSPAIKFYEGNYQVSSFKEGIELISKDKGMILLNYGYAEKKTMANASKPIRKSI